VVAGESPTTYTDLLPLLGELAGRPVAYQQIPLEQVQQAFGADLAAMTELFNRAGFTAQPSPVLHDLGLVPAPVDHHLRRAWTSGPARPSRSITANPQER
jgi:hypothetical protein